MNGEYSQHSDAFFRFILIGIYYFKVENGKFTKFGLSMVFTGAFGNLIDRALFGKVTDFIDFNFFAIFGSRFPVFNIADIFVKTGFEGGRHQTRIDMVMALEEKRFNK